MVPAHDFEDEAVRAIAEGDHLPHVEGCGRRRWRPLQRDLDRGVGRNIQLGAVVITILGVAVVVFRIPANLEPFSRRELDHADVLVHEGRVDKVDDLHAILPYLECLRDCHGKVGKGARTGCGVRGRTPCCPRTSNGQLAHPAAATAGPRPAVATTGTSRRMVHSPAPRAQVHLRVCSQPGPGIRFAHTPKSTVVCGWKLARTTVGNSASYALHLAKRSGVRERGARGAGTGASSTCGLPGRCARSCGQALQGSR